jgi:hypothetical protein
MWLNDLRGQERNEETEPFHHPRPAPAAEQSAVFISAIPSGTGVVAFRTTMGVRIRDGILRGIYELH